MNDQGPHFISARYHMPLGLELSTRLFTYIPYMVTLRDAPYLGFFPSLFKRKAPKKKKDGWVIGHAQVRRNAHRRWIDED